MAMPCTASGVLMAGVGPLMRNRGDSTIGAGRVDARNVVTRHKKTFPIDQSYRLLAAVWAALSAPHSTGNVAFWSKS